MSHPPLLQFDEIKRLESSDAIYCDAKAEDFEQFFSTLSYLLKKDIALFSVLGRGTLLYESTSKDKTNWSEKRLLKTYRHSRRSNYSFYESDDARELYSSINRENKAYSDAITLSEFYNNTGFKTSLTNRSVEQSIREVSVPKVFFSLVIGYDFFYEKRIAEEWAFYATRTIAKADQIHYDDGAMIERMIENPTVKKLADHMEYMLKVAAEKDINVFYFNIDHNGVFPRAGKCSLDSHSLADFYPDRIDWDKSVVSLMQADKSNFYYNKNGMENIDDYKTKRRLILAILYHLVPRFGSHNGETLPWRVHNVPRESIMFVNTTPDNKPALNKW